MASNILLQGLMLNNSAMAAASAVFGAVIVFGLLYLLLERKKKALIAVIIALGLAYGAFYYWSGKHHTSILDVPKSIVTERVTAPPVCVTPAPVPVPKPRPRVIKKAPASPVVKPPVDPRPVCFDPLHVLSCKWP